MEHLSYHCNQQLNQTWFISPRMMKGWMPHWMSKSTFIPTVSSVAHYPVISSKDLMRMTSYRPLGGPCRLWVVHLTPYLMLHEPLPFLSPTGLELKLWTWDQNTMVEGKSSLIWSLERDVDFNANKTNKQTYYIRKLWISVLLLYTKSI